MDQVIPWEALTKALEPHYPDPQGAGRRPKGLERMMRIYFMQQWYNLSDPAMEEALYDSRAMREFAGVDLGEERAPDESTILSFRHLMEAREFGAELLSLVNTHLAEKGLTVTRGTIVDATIINAPSSTKNQDKARDPEMHQTKKGNQWYFGLKLHIGTDSRIGLVHRASVTAANVHDSHQVPNLLHGEETRFYGDSAYRGKAQREGLKELAPTAREFTNKRGYKGRPLT